MNEMEELWLLCQTRGWLEGGGGGGGMTKKVLDEMMGRRERGRKGERRILLSKRKKFFEMKKKESELPAQEFPEQQKLIPLTVETKINTSP